MGGYVVWDLELIALTAYLQALILKQGGQFP